MTISRRAFLTGGTKVAAALFVAPAIIKIDHLMKLHVPEKVIETDANSVNFTVQGIIPGSRVYVADQITGKVLVNEVVSQNSKGWNIPEGCGAPVLVRVRKQGYKGIQTIAGSPYPGGKTKIVQQMQRDLIHS